MGSWPVIGQFSSIGSLGTSADVWLRAEWLESMSAACSGRELLTASNKPQLQLVCSRFIFQFNALLFCVSVPLTSRQVLNSVVRENYL